MTLDNLCYLNEHINIQITKAKQTIMKYKYIFHTKLINTEVKRICYQSLIRPILTYACPIWFNCSDSYMEKLRKFERVCIRHCRNEWRSSESNYKKYISNKKQYNNFNSDRIDLFIIQLTRDHCLRATQNKKNSLIYGPYLTEEHIIKKTIEPNKIPGPEAFIYLDKIKYIQNHKQIPTIYHVKRWPNEKGFNDMKFENPNIHTRYDQSIKVSEDSIFQKMLLKYWWLQP